MTIQGFNEYLRIIKKKRPELSVYFDAKELPCTYFSGKRIAVDAHYIMYKFMSVARTECIMTSNVPFEPVGELESKIFREFLVRCLDFLLRLFQSKMIPLMIFDGDSGPNMDKKLTHEKRSQQRDKRKKEIALLTKEILEKQTKYAGQEALENSSENILRLKKLLTQDVSIAKQDMDAFVTILDALGMPYYVSRADGERLCCVLAIEGHCAAVLSSDSDCFAHGAPIVITEFLPDKILDPQSNEWVTKIKVRRLFDILIGLELNFPTFVQFCILSGCDYNQRCYYTKPLTKKEQEKIEEKAIEIKNKEAKETEEEENEEEEETEENPIEKKKKTNFIMDESTGTWKKKVPVGTTRAMEIIRTVRSIESLPAEYKKDLLNHKRCEELFRYVPSETLIQRGSCHFSTKNLEEKARDILLMYSLESYVELFSPYIV